MKSYKILSIVWILLIAISVSGQTTLTFKLDNPRIVTNTTPFNGNYFEFDVLVKASVAGTYLYSGEIALNYNTASLGNVTGLWVRTKGALLEGLNTDFEDKYSYLATTIGSGIYQVSFGAPASVLIKDPIVLGDFNQVGTDFQTLLTFRVAINGDLTGVAGIEFNEIMNGASSFITGPSTWTVYNNDYEPANFATTYLGRIFAANVPLGWTQQGGIVNGAVSVNTSVWSGNAGATNLLAADNARIHSGATLTVGFNGQATVNNLIIEDAEGLIINSTAANTGSVITGSVSGAGSTVAQRYMTTGAWHFVSSPLSGTIEGFLADNTNIPLKDGSRGMMDYDPAGNKWNDFFTDATVGSLLPGVGYAVRTNADGFVEFTGTINTGNVSVNSLAGWNLVGNPYTSGLGINNESTATNFLNTNLANLDPAYAAVYLWDQLDANNGVPGKYSFISNAPVAIIPGATGLSQGHVQPGQGFLVKMNSATPINFTTAMQAHINNSEAPFKSAKSWPAIALDISSGQHSSSAYIAFNNYMTPGLDPTYDVGAYRGDADLMLYSKLIEDNGVNFALQCLPVNNAEAWIIPLGIESRSGGEVTFTANTIGLHASSTVILEDRLNNVFTPLKTPGNFYRANLAANSSTNGRFFLHTSFQTTGIADELTAQELKAYMVRRDIVIDGKVSSKAVATLYDIQGRSIMVRNLEQGMRNTISAQGLVTGIYLLQVTDNGQQFSIKIPVVEQ